jgi:hypothetical protein
MRFRLRTLLVIMTVLSITFAWLGINYRLVLQRRPYFARFNDHDFALRSAILRPPEPSQITWIRRWLGDHAVSTLLYDPGADELGEDFRRVRTLFPEARIWGWPHDDSPLPVGVNRLPPNRDITI